MSDMIASNRPPVYIENQISLDTFMLIRNGDSSVNLFVSFYLIGKGGHTKTEVTNVDAAHNFYEDINVDEEDDIDEGDEDEYEDEDNEEDEDMDVHDDDTDGESRGSTLDPIVDGSEGSGEDYDYNKWGDMIVEQYENGHVEEGVVNDTQQTVEPPGKFTGLLASCTSTGTHGLRSRIEATINRRLASFYSDRIRENEWIVINTFSVRLHNEGIHATSHDYRICFMDQTIVTKVSGLPSIPYYDFTPFDYIIEKTVSTGVLVVDPASGSREDGGLEDGGDGEDTGSSGEGSGSNEDGGLELEDCGSGDDGDGGSGGSADGETVVVMVVVVVVNGDSSEDKIVILYIIHQL
ncbi:Nucleic acid-binding OB-fold [Arabidopsis suecica]|uniref:Nucleic acid-binding OB-fold n=1 Tax=Arabidopsis suecica TaxID=45249 RepID=A0A8T2FY99_ARASU|nr:Nucleic acid-binding OB-fold [Arabidopsis suecica]